MNDYMASLEKLRARSETIYWPGHGGPALVAQAEAAGVGNVLSIARSTGSRPSLAANPNPSADALSGEGVFRVLLAETRHGEEQVFAGARG